MFLRGYEPRDVPSEHAPRGLKSAFRGYSAIGQHASTLCSHAMRCVVIRSVIGIGLPLAVSAESFH
jgi:hypothetical protein